MEKYAINFNDSNNDDVVLTSTKNSTTVNKELLKPFNHLLSNPGKNIRLVLVEVLNYWMKIPQDKVEKISKIVGVLHNYSLLIDDMQDRSTLRRSTPTAHTIFGHANTALSATYIDLLNIEEALTLNNTEVVATYIKTSRRLWEGQGMEIYWREQSICPSEEEYLEMISKKTGLLFMLVKNLMKPFSAPHKNLDRLLTAFGLYFQILDDYQNLNCDVYFENKGFCEDLTEGKFSFPIVHAINTNRTEGLVILDILSQRTKNVNCKKYCISLIEQCGSFEYTRNKLNELKEIIFEELDKLGGNPYFEKFFSKLSSVSQ